MKSLIIVLAAVIARGLALPSQPVNVRASEITANSVRLTWSYNGPEKLPNFIIMCNPIYDEQLAFREIRGITTTDYIVDNLSPYSKYEMYVVAQNENGRGPLSDPVIVSTTETGAAPENVIALPLGADKIKVQWSEPKIPNGKVKGYRVYFTSDTKNAMMMWHREDARKHNEFVILDGLSPNTTYTIRVQARTSEGGDPLSPPVDVKTESEKK